MKTKIKWLILLLTFLIILFAMDTWGLLPKSQDDSTTIDQEIDAKIAAHLADSEAHMGSGGSLETHRQSDVVDHKANSIVPDKLSKGFFGQFTLVGAFQSLDAFQSGGFSHELEIGGVFLMTTTTLNDRAYLSAYASNVAAVEYNKDPLLEFNAKFEGTGAVEAYFGIGDREGIFDEYFCGFKILNGHLYARIFSASDNIEHLSEISGIALNDEHTWTMQYFHGVGGKFYIDGTLVAELNYTSLDNTRTSPYQVDITNTSAGNQPNARLKPFYLLYP